MYSTLTCFYNPPSTCFLIHCKTKKKKEGIHRYFNSSLFHRRVSLDVIKQICRKQLTRKSVSTITAKTLTSNATFVGSDGFRWISEENRTFPRVLFWIESFELNRLNRRPNYFPIILECRRAFVDSSCSRPRSKARIKEEKRTLNVWFIVYDWKKNGVSIWARLNRARARDESIGGI